MLKIHCIFHSCNSSEMKNTTRCQSKCQKSLRTASLFFTFIVLRLREIEKIIGKFHFSVQTIINYYLRNGNLDVKARSGRPKKLSQREELLILKTNPKISYRIM